MSAFAIRQSLRWAQAGLELVYPTRCQLCDAPVTETRAICPDCFATTRFLRGLTCDLCGTALEGDSDRSELCDDCLTLARPWEKGRAVFAYEGAGRRFVLKMKHGDRPDLARVATRWMCEAGHDVLTGSTVVPVPVHWSRRISRRYNQAAELARHLSREADLDFAPQALRRTRPTKSQDHRTVSDRFANLEGSIEAGPDCRLQGRRVCIVDDVMTSGATLSACAHAALDAGADRVFVVVLARVVKRP